MKQPLTNNRTSDAGPAKNSCPKHPLWEQSEGTPLPLGATWIEDEEAFNFAVYAEHADGVPLLLYSEEDVESPILTFPFDFHRNKSGRIWHCRLPLNEMRGARYYAYSVSGQAVARVHSFDPDKVLLDPYSKCVFFPPEFDRKMAIAPGPNAGKAPLPTSDDFVELSVPLKHATYQVAPRSIVVLVRERK